MFRLKNWYFCLQKQFFDFLQNFSIKKHENFSLELFLRSSGSDSRYGNYFVKFGKWFPPRELFWEVREVIIATAISFISLANDSRRGNYFEKLGKWFSLGELFYELQQVIFTAGIILLSSANYSREMSKIWLKGIQMPK